MEAASSVTEYDTVSDLIANDPWFCSSTPVGSDISWVSGELSRGRAFGCTTLPCRCGFLPLISFLKNSKKTYFVKKDFVLYLQHQTSVRAMTMMIVIMTVMLTPTDAGSQVVAVVGIIVVVIVVVVTVVVDVVVV